MITGAIKSQIDQIWNAFWSGGISNPLEVIEQITYLLFLRRLDDLHTLEENKSAKLKQPMARRVFAEGNDGIGKAGGRPYQDLRWSRFKHLAPAEMYTVVGEHVFPFLRALGGDDSTYSHHMKDARFTIPTPALLAKVVDLLDDVPMEDRDTKGDLYEYMLGKIASAGQNGQFRTPRHIIRLMIEMTAPQPTDLICDPACGTAGFLVAAGEYLRERHPNILHDAKLREHFHHRMFHGFDFDNTMLRIGSMNMLLHGVENPDIRYRDSLAQDHAADEEAYTLVLANPPFAGSLDYENTAKDLLRVVKTKKTELLFLALFMRLLKPGGRAAVIVPAGVLESDSEAHQNIRKTLIDDNRLEAVIALPHWVFKPYASVATAVLIFGRAGTTESVWFYRIENDGFNDDAMKTPRPGSELPEVLSLWQKRASSSRAPRKRKYRWVTREEIVENDYDLCERVYLSGYEYPSDVPLFHLSALFDIDKGKSPAALAEEGVYPFVTSAEELKRHITYDFDGEAICIPIVSSTGHGHASIKRIHYMTGQFAAATITAVLMKKTEPMADVYVPYVYYFLLAHKDDLLVPLMRGAANVSLSLDRLRALRVPLPKLEDQKRHVRELELIGKELAHAKMAVDEAETALEDTFKRFIDKI
ncbi:MAG: N-6 DNA methylase [Gemmatimonadaceae bacterium]|nr:N-6 DNA methylase [Gemmatimonadaceae bacterium]MBA3557844.1 N-6 DNA methylase [Gemmatimonadaceae bacterium]